MNPGQVYLGLQRYITGTISVERNWYFECRMCSERGPSQYPGSLRYDNGPCGSVEAPGNLLSASALSQYYIKNAL